MTTAGAENAAAVGRSHASAETVLVHTLAAGRLKCSFHDILFLYFRVRTAKVVISVEIAKYFLLNKKACPTEKRGRCNKAEPKGN